MRAAICSSLALAALLGSPALASERGGHIAVDERQPMVMLVVSPKGAELNTHTSDLLQIVSEVLGAKTNLVVMPTEQIGEEVARVCGARIKLACFVRTVRRDYDRTKLEQPDGSVLPYDDHLKRLREQGVSPPRHLLVLSSQPHSDQQEQISAMLIDTDVALRFIHDAGKKVDEDTLENRLFEGAVQTESGVAVVEDRRSVRDFFQTLLEVKLRPAFERSSNWEPYGEITIKTEVSGLEIELDGKSIGRTQAPETRITGVTPGSRKLALWSPAGEWERFTQPVDVQARQATPLIPVLAAAPGAKGTWLKSAAFWGGIGVATAGAVLTGFAIVAKPKLVYVETCPAGNCADTRSSEFAGLCELFSSDPSCLTGSKGVLAAPLGYSLLATGGTWAVGSELFDGDSTWVPLAIGAAVGVASYGISAALDGGGSRAASP